MKIAIITSAFFESTFPLIRELRKQHRVDCYSMLSQSFLSPPNFDISQNYRGETGVITEKEKERLIPNEIKSYFKNDLGFLRLMITGRNNKKWVREMGREVSNSNYDVIHLIGISLYYKSLLPYFKNKGVIFSLHEVEMARVLTKFWNVKSIIKRFLFKKLEKIIYTRPKTRFIVFSKNEYNKLVQKKSVKTENCRIIRFGLFDVFREYSNKGTLYIPNKSYFLLYGYMNKYKGIDLFFEAAIKMEKSGIQFVAAGKDVEGFLSKQKYIPNNLVIINKYLSDSEISYLINNCYAVVMPYRSASQSGIQSTAFALNKPIIASNIDGINEYLIDNYNSLILNEYNLEGLIEVVNKIMNEKMYSKLLKNIKLNPFKNNNSIDMISIKTIEEYKLLL
tara:strand:+ start:951 stop:2129 length:1179 start_codon:yes stop_codon:yes gene_type:complete